MKKIQSFKTTAIIKSKLMIPSTAGSLFFSQNFSRDYEDSPARKIDFDQLTSLQTIQPKGEWDETWVAHAPEDKQTADSSHVFEDIHTCQNNLIN